MKHTGRCKRVSLAAGVWIIIGSSLFLWAAIVLSYRAIFA